MGFRLNSDDAAVGLSGLCIVHCIVTPLLLLLTPFSALHVLENEAIHVALLFVVVPISVYALAVGFKRHQQKFIVLAGLAGMAFLISAVLLGHDFVGQGLLGHEGETILTVIGSCTIAFAHWHNGKKRAAIPHL